MQPTPNIQRELPAASTTYSPVVNATQKDISGSGALPRLTQRLDDFVPASQLAPSKSRRTACYAFSDILPIMNCPHAIQHRSLVSPGRQHDVGSKRPLKRKNDINLAEQGYRGRSRQGLRHQGRPANSASSQNDSPFSTIIYRDTTLDICHPQSRLCYLCNSLPPLNSITTMTCGDFFLALIAILFPPIAGT
jgi:hypothetical protein